jgi:SAM-dependent methyltransferase
MDKDQFRRRAYDCYVSGFKETVTISNAGESKGARRYRRYLRKRLEPWLVDIPRSAVVADLGCGDGILLQVFQELGFSNLHGVEGSNEMWALCSRKFPHVEKGDLRDFLKRHKNSYDIVALFDVLEHFTREEATELLDDAYASMRAGGQLLLQLPNGDSPFAGGVFAADVTHEALYTRGSLGHMLAISGFELTNADEHSPEPTDARSTIRWVAWKALRLAIGMCHRVETGGGSSGVYTRVMRARARKVSENPQSHS